MLVSPKLLERAVRLHGHLGPFLVLGLKMTLLVEEIFGQKPLGCEVEVINEKPYLCTVDGIRALIDNATVTVREGDGIKAKFVGLQGKKVVVKVKRGTIKEYAQIPWERCEEAAHKVLQSRDENLFEFVSLHQTDH